MKNVVLSITRKVVPSLCVLAGAKWGVGEPLIVWLSFLIPAVAASGWGAWDEWQAATAGGYSAIKDTLASFVRNALPPTMVFLVAQGWVDAASVEGISGIVLAASGAIWGPADEAVHAASAPTATPL
jgi:hypothetical protein